MQTDDRELKLAKRQPVASGSDSHHSAIRLGGSPTQQVRVSGGRIKNVSIRYTSIANLEMEWPPIPPKYSLVCVILCTAMVKIYAPSQLVQVKAPTLDKHGMGGISNPTQLGIYLVHVILHILSVS